MENKTAKPAAYQVVAERAEEIIQTWESMVRRRIRPARREPEWILRDHIPYFLDSLAETLNPAIVKDNACEDNDTCRKHGEQRATSTSTYRPKELVEEYGLLREAIFEIVRKYGTLTTRDIDIVLRSIDSGVAEAVQAFAETSTAMGR